jgi:hypothetical protein
MAVRGVPRSDRPASTKRARWRVGAVQPRKEKLTDRCEQVPAKAMINATSTDRFVGVNKVPPGEPGMIEDTESTGTTAGQKKKDTHYRLSFIQGLEAKTRLVVRLDEGCKRTT